MYLAQILLNSLVMAMQNLLIAVPLFLIYAVSRVFNFAIADLAVVAGYVFYAGYSASGSLVVGAFASIITGALLAYVLFVLLEPYIKRGQHLLGFLVSMFFGVIAKAVMALIFGSGGQSIFADVLPTIDLGELYITLPGLWTLIVGTIFVLSMWIFLHYTPFGRMFRGLSQDFNLAESLGVYSTRLRLSAYFIAIFLAGFVGISIGSQTALHPEMGVEMILIGLITFLMGGTQNIWGVIVASIIVTLVPELIFAFTDVSTSLKMLTVFILAGITLVFFPRGLSSISHRKV